MQTVKPQPHGKFVGRDASIGNTFKEHRMSELVGTDIKDGISIHQKIFPLFHQYFGLFTFLLVFYLSHSFYLVAEILTMSFVPEKQNMYKMLQVEVENLTCFMVASTEDAIQILLQRG